MKYCAATTLPQPTTVNRTRGLQRNYNYNYNYNYNCLTAEDAETQRNAEETMKAEELNSRSGEVVDAAIRVHSALGPGLLESAYEMCLAHELKLRGLQVETQVLMPVVYRGVRLEAAYRIDLLVDTELIVELKSVAALLPVHEAQVLSYLRLSSRRLALLINFNVPHLKDGIKRLVNNLR